MGIVWILLAAGLKIFCDKLFLVGFLLLIGLLKKRTLKQKGISMDDYITSLPFRTLQTVTSLLYLPAALLSSALSYGLLTLAHVSAALPNTIGLFLLALLLSSLLFYLKGRALLAEGLARHRNTSPPPSENEPPLP
ncbi:MAG: hypothetical protein SOR61_04720 [Evtepia sp.]|uniref:hypothetical protein n=1 Tax=Evtepia sp. TaxID=2773933 RepID=UPI002A751AE2|nr:hypothetical protein [Evtepia sp.]MDY3014485.1 hypothetical protein [Evtepia sp.]